MDMQVNSFSSDALVQKSTQAEKIAETVSASENAAPEAAPKSENVDRVDFSDDARRYLDEENSSNSDNNVEYYTSYIKPDTDDLSQYTSNELSKLLTDGEITRTEYNEELARRNG